MKSLRLHERVVKNLSQLRRRFRDFRASVPPPPPPPPLRPSVALVYVAFFAGMRYTDDRIAPSPRTTMITHHSKPRREFFDRVHSRIALSRLNN